MDGYGYPHLLKTLPFGGREVTAQLLSLLVSKGLDMADSQDWAAVNSIKEKACFVAPDLQQETKVGACTAADSIDPIALMLLTCLLLRLAQAMPIAAD